MKDYGLFSKPVPVVNAPNPHANEPQGNYSTGTKYANATQLRNQANTNKYPLNNYSADDRFRTAGGMQPNRGLTPKPSNSGGLSFSFGGGRGGGQYSSVPNVSLTPQTFAPYVSTYTPPTPATPVPYDYATRSPYVYGDGLSNAGAAYDIWGSKPGTNPYLLSTPADYTPGILGLDPVTLPGNMPNKGANINALSNVKQKERQKFTGTPEQIIRDYGYTGRTVPMQNNVPPSMRDSAPNASVMLAAAAANVRSGRYNNMQEAMNAQQAFNKKYPTLTPAENRALIEKSQAMLLSQDQRPKVEKKVTRASIVPSAGTGASGPPGRNYETKKASTASAVKAITSKMNRDNAPPAKKASVAKKSTPASRPTAPARGYSTKDVNTSFKARRDVRNLFA